MLRHYILSFDLNHCHSLPLRLKRYIIAKVSLEALSCKTFVDSILRGTAKHLNPSDTVRHNSTGISSAPTKIFSALGVLEPSRGHFLFGWTHCRQPTYRTASYLGPGSFGENTGARLFTSRRDALDGTAADRLSSATQRASNYQKRKEAGLDPMEEDLAMPFLPHSPMDHIERQILASIQRGELDNLKGKGQPLPDTHDSQFFKVDPLMSALARSLGAQNIRPESIDARDAFANQMKVFELKVKEALAKAKGSGSQLEALRRGNDPGLKYNWEQLVRLHKEYNDAALKDKELYGAAWPLNPYPRISYESEFDRMLDDKS